MKTYGLTRKFTTEIDGEKVEVIMKSSVGLLGLYKSYFMTDLLSDLMKMLQGITHNDLDQFMKIDANKQIEDYTAAELNTLVEVFNRNATLFDTSILIQIMVALILNAAPEHERIAMPDALDVVPPSFLTDKDIVAETINLIVPFLGEKKKPLVR